MNRHPIIIKGRQSCRRGDGIEGNHTRPGQIIRWAGSRNGHERAILSVTPRISTPFPATAGFPGHGTLRMNDTTPPPGSMRESGYKAGTTRPKARSQAPDCAENSPRCPSFGQTGQKAVFYADRRVDTQEMGH